MSSHHIVREKQEPALLISGMDNFTDELLGQLLEWSPTVITTPLTAEKLNSQGIKIDWIVSDDVAGALQSDTKHFPIGNNSLTETVLKQLVAQGYPAVNIVTDEFELNDYIAFAGLINLVIFYHHQKIYSVNSGFSKWKPAGEEISILSPINNLTFTGLEKTRENSFKTTADGFFSLEFDELFVFIAEAL